MKNYSKGTHAIKGRGLEEKEEEETHSLGKVDIGWWQK